MMSDPLGRRKAIRMIAHPLADVDKISTEKPANNLMNRQDIVALQLSAAPPVYLFRDFASREETQHVIKAARSQLNRAVVSGDEGGFESDGRSGSNCWIPHGQDAVVEGLTGRIADVVGIPLNHAEALQVIYYDTGQKYEPHFDAWDASTATGRRCLAQGGQRKITCLLYLNDVTGGGGTVFPRLNLEIPAVAGNLVVFYNCEPGTNDRNPNCLHGSRPVESGEKWACNLWFREQPLRA